MKYNLNNEKLSNLSTVWTLSVSKCPKMQSFGANIKLRKEVLAGWFPQITEDDTKYLQHVLLLKSFRFTRLLAWYNNFIQLEGYNLSIIQIAGRRVT